MDKVMTPWIRKGLQGYKQDYMDTDRTSWIQIGLHGYEQDNMNIEKKTTWIQIGLHGYRQDYMNTDRTTRIQKGYSCELKNGLFCRYRRRQAHSLFDEKGSSAQFDVEAVKLDHTRYSPVLILTHHNCQIIQV